MKISALLKKELMIMDLQAQTKNDAIEEMIQKLVDHGYVNNAELFKQKIIERENLSSTGVGQGIAMPHAQTNAVNEPVVLFAKSKNGLDYDALDGKPVYLFFMIAVPEGGHSTHLKALAQLSKLLLNEEFIKELKDAGSPDDVYRLFQDVEGNTTHDEQAQPVDEKPFIVAVTACPTGIAHTYMAEEALKKKAAEMNVEIRVETNGQEGVKNKLTEEEIERAIGVIVAADTKVEMDRFDGKRVLQKKVSEGISNPEELIRKILNQEAPIFRAETKKQKEEETEPSQSLWNKIYKDLMNGVTYMLPFVVGGGILLAVSFLFENVLGSDSEIFKFLNTLGGNAFNFLIPILAGYIAVSVGDRPALMPGMVGGLMAVHSNAGFLGGLAAGFLAGYIVIWMRKLFRGIPQSLEGLKPIFIYPVVGLFLIGTLMYFIVGPIFSIINTAMIDFLNGLGTANKVLLGAVLGGMMATDMGGPFNKAAYTFSIGIFTETGDGALMAAVMAGGMVPPLAIALATTIFKNKFNEAEKRSGVSNYILGLSFITEGAIPYAATDPLRVIGSSILGSAIAGGLTQLWNTSIPAPHGGIFVISLAEKPIMFLLSLLIGTVVAAFVLGVWRKPVQQ